MYNIQDFIKMDSKALLEVMAKLMKEDEGYSPVSNPQRGTRYGGLSAPYYADLNRRNQTKAMDNQEALTFAKFLYDQRKSEESSRSRSAVTAEKDQYKELKDLYSLFEGRDYSRKEDDRKNTRSDNKAAKLSERKRKVDEKKWYFDNVEKAAREEAKDAMKDSLSEYLVPGQDMPKMVGRMTNNEKEATRRVIYRNSLNRLKNTVNPYATETGTPVETPSGARPTGFKSNVYGGETPYIFPMGDKTYELTQDNGEDVLIIKDKDGNKQARPISSTNADKLRRRVQVSNRPVLEGLSPEAKEQAINNMMARGESPDNFAPDKGYYGPDDPTLREAARRMVDGENPPNYDPIMSPGESYPIGPKYEYENGKVVSIGGEPVYNDNIPLPDQGVAYPPSGEFGGGLLPSQQPQPASPSGYPEPPQGTIKADINEALGKSGAPYFSPELIKESFRSLAPQPKQPTMQTTPEDTRGALGQSGEPYLSPELLKELLRTLTPNTLQKDDMRDITSESMGQSGEPYLSSELLDELFRSLSPQGQYSNEESWY